MNSSDNFQSKTYYNVVLLDENRLSEGHLEKNSVELMKIGLIGFLNFGSYQKCRVTLKRIVKYAFSCEIALIIRIRGEKVKKSTSEAGKIQQIDEPVEFIHATLA